MDRLRGWVVPPFGVGAVWALLVAMVALGLNVTGVLGVRPFGSTSALDYSAPPFGAFLPLRAPFVEDVLGEPVLGGGVGGGGGGQGSGLGSSLHPAVRHGLTNDAQAQAYEIDAVPFTARSDTARASRERTDPAACSKFGSTVWYRYRATENATLVASTAATYPASLGVFAAPASRSSRALGCDTNSAGLARVAFPAFAGSTYLVQITGRVRGGKLAFSLDHATQATPVSVLGDGTTAGAEYDFDYPKISSNGRYVVFESRSTELDPRCAARSDGSMPCGTSQVYIRDLESGFTELASVTANGGVANDISLQPHVSGDGRYVTFASKADNLEPAIEPPSPKFHDAEWDVFVRDRLLGRTVRVTRDKDGKELSGSDGSISDDGRYIAWVGDWEQRKNAFHANYPIADVFVMDMLTREYVRASVADDGQLGNHDSVTPQISPDGRYVTFWSRASNLTPGLSPSTVENAAGVFYGRVYVYDLERKHLTLECAAQDGTPSNDECVGPSVSEGGRFSLFWSPATNLVKGAPQGGVGLKAFNNLYLRDRRSGRLELLNVTDQGEAKGELLERQVSDVRAHRLLRPWVSPDGSVVAFDAAAALTAGDDNGVVDAYVRDRVRGRTIRVSETPAGNDANAQSVYPYPSGDGSSVVFLSQAGNLAGETDTDWDVFVCRWRDQ